ncbi:MULTISPECIES: phytoene/squalene synthase family protein [Rhodomicrobium]|uniref:phytoene/squalene synthase family protein n=1 Tax=Rhodomicrobium TaxID=1068 RepID=UPI000B4B73B1|nr:MULTISPECIES: phytoene/squalene synthase family protein [Rhodomicrobium]
MDKIVEYSRERIEKGSRSFAAAARLFDAETRAHAYMLYAWCRHCDDVIDGQELGFAGGRAATASPAERLAELRKATRRAVRGDWDEMVFGALHRVVAERGVPERYLLDHLEGFAMDVEGRRYRTLDDTLGYCYHVAGVVGVMMAVIMGVKDAATLDRASDLGIAFQLTNITRDVMEDAALGRVYLPEDWLEEAGVPRSAIADPANRQKVHEVTERLLAVSDRFYVSARHGIAFLPFRSAWAIASARFVYRDIGRLVRREGAAAWDRRARVSAARKLYGVARSLATIARSHAHGRLVEIPSRKGLWTRPRGSMEPGMFCG